MAEDAFAPLYRKTQDQIDEGRWLDGIATSRRPQTVATPQDVQSLVGEIAPKYGVDPRLVQSVMGLESGGQAGAVSKKGAQGLMQLMPGTARRFGVVDSLDPAQNIEGGVRYLAWLRDQFPGRTDLQLAAYHAGEGAVRNAGYAIPDTHDGNLSTAAYVANVLGRYQGLTPMGTGGAAGQRGARGAVAAQTPQVETQKPGMQLDFDPGQLPRAARLASGMPSLAGIGADTGAAAAWRAQADMGRAAQGSTTFEASLGALGPLQTAQELRTAPRAPGAGPRETPLEPGLVEPPGFGRVAGNFVSSAVGMLKNLASAVVAGETLTGLKTPGEPDPLHAEAVATTLGNIEKSLSLRLGDEPPTIIDKLVGAAGTSLISLVPAAGASAFLKGVAKVAPGVARTGAAVSGGVIEAAGEAGELFDQAKPLVGEKEAASRALQSFGANAVLVSLTDRLGIFGDEAKLLRRTFNGVVTNSLQEATQYDIERRLLWVPAEQAGAQDLLKQGWQQQGDRIIKPFSPKDAAEAAFIGGVIGGAGAAAVGHVVEGISTPWQNVVARETEAAGGEVHPAFSLMAAIEAAQRPTTPREGVDLDTWQRWGNYIKDVLPDTGGGMMGGILGGERGAVGGERQMLFTQRAQATQILQALAEGGEQAQTVTEQLKAPSPVEAQQMVQTRLEDINAQIAQLSTEAPGPTLQQGAEGIAQEHYRKPDGSLAMPLTEIPSQELELQDFLWQPDAQGRRGIKLSTEADVPGELARRISVPAVGRADSLQNNTSGLTLQQQAERAHQAEFITSADKEALLEAMDRSLVQGKKVYSQQATGTIPIISNPAVRASYQAVYDAVSTIRQRTAEQVGGVRHRAAVHAEAQGMIREGQFTLADIREMYPNTTLNDTMASALVQSLNTIGEQLGVAAQAYLESGERLGSREEQALQQTMGLLAELDPVRLGVSAAQARGLGILNDPLSGYTQYLNNLHTVLEAAPSRTMGQIARRILAAHPTTPIAKEILQNPAFLAELFAAHQEQLSIGHLSAEEQALVQAAYEPHGEPRTVEAWNALFAATTAERTRLALEKARAAWAASMGQLRAEQEARRVGYEGRQLSLPTGEEARALFEPSVQLPLQLHEFQDVQDSITAFLEGRLAADQAALLERALRPYSGRVTQEQMMFTKAMAQYAIQNPELVGRTEGGKTIQRSLDVEDQRAMDANILGAVKQSTQPGFQDFFLELWFNALLSNPATHVANIAGNLSTTIWAIPERFIAEQFGFGREGHVTRGESTAMLYAFTHAIGDAWVGAYRSYQEGKPLSGLGREYSRNEAPAATATNMGLDPHSPLGRTMDFIFNYIGLASGGRFASKALMAADEFSKMWNYRMELNAVAYREAVKQGYEGPAWGEHVQRIVDTPALSQIQEAAKSFSVIQAFQNELRPGGMGAALQGWANLSVDIPGTEQSLPVGRMIVPFVQTPMNIARYANERNILLAPFLQSVREDLRAGGARQDMAEAKMTLGTMAMVSMAALAIKGAIAGRGPEDPHLRAIWLESHREYSLKVPFTNIWVPYDRFGPLGMMIGMVADMVQIAGESQIPLAERAAIAPLYAFLKNIGNQTFMQGMNSFFDAMTPRPGQRPDQVGDNMVKFFRRMSTGFVQPSALLAATARVLDPVEKEALSWVDTLYARVPGWRNDVPSRRTLGGDKVLYGYGWGPDILVRMVNAYTPFKLGDGQIYPADQEILTNKMTLGSVPISIEQHAVGESVLATGDQYVDQQAQKPLRLSAKQHEAYAVLAGGNQEEARKLGLEVPTEILQDLVQGLSGRFAATPPPNVLGLNDYLDWAIKQPEYRDPEQTSPGPGGGKEAIFKEATLVYRKVGLDLLLAQDETLQTRVEESRIQRAVQRLPLQERPEAVQEMRQGAREGRQDVREGMGLHVGPGAPAGRR